MHDDRLPELFTSDQWQVLAGHYGLARRQAQIARWICRGLSNKAIAEELSVSPETIGLHTRALYRKLVVSNRVGVAVRMVIACRQLQQRGGGGRV